MNVSILVRIYVWDKTRVSIGCIWVEVAVGIEVWIEGRCWVGILVNIEVWAGIGGERRQGWGVEWCTVMG